MQTLTLAGVDEPRLDPEHRAEVAGGEDLPGGPSATRRPASRSTIRSHQR